MAEKVKGKGNLKEKAFVWTEALTVTLLKVCKEYQGTHGYQTFDWNDIKEGFEKKTELKVRKECAKNKVEHMKKLWRAWSDLRFKVTGAGCDEKTRMVTLDDEWWDSKGRKQQKLHVPRQMQRDQLQTSSAVPTNAVNPDFTNQAEFGQPNSILTV